MAAFGTKNVHSAVRMAYVHNKISCAVVPYVDWLKTAISNPSLTTYDRMTGLTADHKTKL